MKGFVQLSLPLHLPPAPRQYCTTPPPPPSHTSSHVNPFCAIYPFLSPTITAPTAILPPVLPTLSPQPATIFSVYPTPSLTHSPFLYFTLRHLGPASTSPKSQVPSFLSTPLPPPIHLWENPLSHRIVAIQFCRR